MARIPDEELERLKHEVSLVSLVEASGVKLRCQGKDLFAEFFEANLHGIVMHQQRAIGRHGLGDPGHRLGRHGPVERQNPPVGGVVDVAAEFHRDGAVATRQKAGRG